MSEGGREGINRLIKKGQRVKSEVGKGEGEMVNWLIKRNNSEILILIFSKSEVSESGREVVNTQIENA